MVLSYC